jgi:hypothetical protein
VPTPTPEWLAARGAGDRVRELWRIGLSMAAIAERMGCTKNAISGYAHRNGFDRRPSPIQPKAKSAKTHPKKARPRARPLAPKPPPELVALPAPAFRTCQWIEADDRRTWSMCGAATVRKLPYCEEHAARCYHGIRSSRQEMAA